MTDQDGRSPIEQYRALRQTVVELAVAVSTDADRQLRETTLNEADRGELQEGVSILSEAIMRFYDCADALLKEHRLGPAVFELNESFHGVIGAGLLCGRHIAPSEALRKQIAKQQVAAAHSRRAANKNERAEDFRKLIEGAARKSEDATKFKNPGSFLAEARKINPDIDRKTVERYRAYIDTNKRA